MKVPHTYKISSLCGGGCGCGCVGVTMEDGAIYVTNTTTADSPVTSFTPDEWKAFIAGVKNGEFDL